jgi:porphobilinogen deaminase
LLRNITSKSEKNEDLAADIFLKTEYEKIQNLRTRFEVETSDIRRRLELINQRKQELEFRLGALNR